MSPALSCPASPSDDGLPPCPEFTRKPGGPYPVEVREYALLLVASAVKRKDIAARIGCSTEILRAWVRAAEEAGAMPVPPVPETTAAESVESKPSMPQRRPRDPATGLAEHEAAAILDLKKRHPSMGPAQIRAQLKRFQGWRLSVRAIARVLKANGYELVHTASRPKGEEVPHRFEAPRRNAVWQMDFVDLRVGPERRALLLVIDDFSRYLVAHALLDTPDSEDVVKVLEGAIRRHGKPEAVYTDRGGPFLAWTKPSSLGAFLERELVDHHVSAPYRPEGRGKVEAVAKTVRRELWDLRHFESTEEAEQGLDHFFFRYNHRRAHMGIGGVTPADRFHGRWEEVLSRVEAVSRNRQGAAALLSGSPRDPFVTEETLPDGPFEVLRLLVENGRMHLAFLGHRVELGPVRP